MVISMTVLLTFVLGMVFLSMITQVKTILDYHLLMQLVMLDKLILFSR